MLLADLPTASAPFVSVPSSRGTRGRGLTYERKVGQWLRLQIAGLGWQLFDHPWLQLADSVCQPDFVLISPSGCAIIIEAKLTECDCAAQTDKYRRALSGWPTTVVQIARRVTSRPTVSCFDDITDNGLMLLWL